MNMRVGAFDRSIRPTYGENMQLVSNTPKVFWVGVESWENQKIFEDPESQISEISELKNHEKCFFNC